LHLRGARGNKLIQICMRFLNHETARHVNLHT
jgi:hypothetical protein